MNEMIDRVTKALVDSSSSEPTYKTYERMAHAAIEAMREPTDAMLYAGLVQHADLPFHQTVEIWQAMIDEALR